MSNTHKSSSFENGFVTFFKIGGKVGKHIILFLGRFFTREIPLQARWLSSAYARMNTANIHPIITVILLVIVGVFVLIAWAVLRAIFIPNHHP